MKKESWNRNSNFKWCVENDFQVYIRNQFGAALADKPKFYVKTSFTMNELECRLI